MTGKTYSEIVLGDLIEEARIRKWVIVLFLASVAVFLISTNVRSPTVYTQSFSIKWDQTWSAEAYVPLPILLKFAEDATNRYLNQKTAKIESIAVVHDEVRTKISWSGSGDSPIDFHSYIVDVDLSVKHDVANYYKRRAEMFKNLAANYSDETIEKKLKEKIFFSTLAQELANDESVHFFSKKRNDVIAENGAIHTLIRVFLIVMVSFVFVFIYITLSALYRKKRAL